MGLKNEHEYHSWGFHPHDLCTYQRPCLLISSLQEIGVQHMNLGSDTNIQTVAPNRDSCCSISILSFILTIYSLIHFGESHTQPPEHFFHTSFTLPKHLIPLPHPLCTAGAPSYILCLASCWHYTNQGLAQVLQKSTVVKATGARANKPKLKS